METLGHNIARACKALASADALLIGAGAGMGVDSGMPDFRGDEGFWNAYPAFKGKRFSEMSNPVWFASDPEQAWGFFGHRYNLYSSTKPHEGFQVLRRLAASMPAGAGIFTSNVDGHFQKAGFTEVPIVECHGSIHHFQCSELCSTEIWSAENVQVDVDPDTIRARGPVPRCPNCQAVARPNILMFGDYSWIQDRTVDQERRLAEWLTNVRPEKLVVIELGAGTAIPTVRWECERHGASGTLVRINPRDAEVGEGEVSIPLGALEGLRRLEAGMEPP